MEGPGQMWAGAGHVEPGEQVRSSYFTQHAVEAFEDSSGRSGLG